MNSSVLISNRKGVITLSSTILPGASSARERVILRMNFINTMATLATGAVVPIGAVLCRRHFAVSSAPRTSPEN